MISRRSKRLVALFGWLLAFPAFAVDWSVQPEKTLTFFYPGSASWEKLLTKTIHDGASGIRSKTACRTCHEGEEISMGRTLGSDADSPLYRPHIGVSGFEGTLQIAVEGESLYFKIVLPHLDAGKLSLLLDNDAYMHSALSGCWSSCHDDLRGMDSSGDMDLTKYLSLSRTQNTRTGGGENIKSESELRSLMADGQYLELMGVAFSPEGSHSYHGVVLAKREQDESGIISSMIVNEDESTSVVLTRPLTSDSATVKSVEAGGSYALGMSLHLGDDQGSDHLVTLGVTFDIDEAGGIRFTE